MIQRIRSSRAWLAWPATRRAAFVGSSGSARLHSTRSSSTRRPRSSWSTTLTTHCSTSPGLIRPTVPSPAPTPRRRASSTRADRPPSSGARGSRDCVAATCRPSHATLRAGQPPRRHRPARTCRTSRRILSRRHQLPVRGACGRPEPGRIGAQGRPTRGAGPVGQVDCPARMGGTGTSLGKRPLEQVEGAVPATAPISLRRTPVPDAPPPRGGDPRGATVQPGPPHRSVPADPPRAATEIYRFLTSFTAGVQRGLEKTEFDRTAGPGAAPRPPRDE